MNFDEAKSVSNRRLFFALIVCCASAVSEDKPPQFPLNYQIFDEVSDAYEDQEGAQRLPIATFTAVVQALKNSPVEHLSKNVQPGLSFKKMISEPMRFRGAVTRITGRLGKVTKVRITAKETGADSVWFGQIVLRDQSIVSFVSLEEPGQKFSESIRLTGIFVQRYAFPNQCDGDMLSWTPLIFTKSTEPGHGVENFELDPTTQLKFPRKGISFNLNSASRLHLKVVKHDQEWLVECDGQHYSLVESAKKGDTLLAFLTRKSREYSDAKSKAGGDPIAHTIELSIPEVTPMESVTQIVKQADQVGLTNIHYHVLQPACHYQIKFVEQDCVGVHVLERGKTREGSLTSQSLRDKLAELTAKGTVSRVIISYDSKVYEGDMKAVFKLCSKLKISACGLAPSNPER